VIFRSKSWIFATLAIAIVAAAALGGCKKGKVDAFPASNAIAGVRGGAKIDHKPACKYPPAEPGALRCEPLKAA
jgi:hypothetical protein